MWTAMKLDDGSLVVPVHIDTPDGWHADGAVRLTQGDRDHAEYASHAATAAELLSDPQRDAALHARWEAHFIEQERRSA